MERYQKLLQSGHLIIKLTIRFDEKRRWAFLDTYKAYGTHFISHDTQELRVTFADKVIAGAAFERVPDETD